MLPNLLPHGFSACSTITYAEGGWECVGGTGCCCESAGQEDEAGGAECGVATHLGCRVQPQRAVHALLLGNGLVRATVCRSGEAGWCCVCGCVAGATTPQAVRVSCPSAPPLT